MGMRVANILAGLAIAGLAWPAQADPVEDFYKSHPITMLLGYSSGGGFDLYGRVVSKYIGKNIPGHPAVVVQNRPGAGSLLAANHVYNVSPKDGSVISL